MNVGTVKGGGITRVGDRGYFMNSSHVGHDCQVGNDVIFATSATLGGHCEIGDFVFIGGLSAVHQFTRIGPQVMVGGVCGVRGDVIPFGLVNGQYAALEGLNIIGMKRRKFTKRAARHRARRSIKSCFTAPASSPNGWTRCSRWRREDPAIAEILAFIGDGKHRALCLPADDGNKSDDGIAAAMTISGFRYFIAGRRDRGRRRDAVRGRGFACRARHRRRCCSRCEAPAIRRGWSVSAITGSRSASSAGPIKLFRSEGCRDLIFIGTLVRPSLSEIRLDWGTLRVIGNVMAAFRGGDDHLLSGIGRILEQDGFRMVGIKDVAPDLLMPEGCITRATPDAGARPISRGDARCCARSARSTSVRPPS